jgi:hypothetical protein
MKGNIPIEGTESMFCRACTATLFTLEDALGSLSMRSTADCMPSSTNEDIASASANTVIFVKYLDNSEANLLVTRGRAMTTAETAYGII